jgi:hypothetical protein
MNMRNGFDRIKNMHTLYDKTIMSDNGRYERGFFSCSVMSDNAGVWSVKKVKETGELKWVLHDENTLSSAKDPITGKYIEKKYVSPEERVQCMLRDWRRKNGTSISDDGYSSDDSYGDQPGSSKMQTDWDNYSNQLNPNNSAYHSSRC